MSSYPVGQERHPEREQADVEAELAGPGVGLLFRRREQIGQDGQARGLQLGGHVPVARAAPAAAAAVREQFAELERRCLKRG